MLNVLEIIVNRGVADVRHLVDIPQLPQHVAPDTFGRDAALVLRPFVFEFVDELLDFRMIDVSFVEGFEDARLDFRALVDFFSAVGFRHHKADKLHSLERRKSSAAFFAFAAAADGATLLAESGVYDLCIEIFTLYAAHRYR